MSTLGRLALSSIFALVPATALALQQPDGTTIPAGNNLAEYLLDEGEPIDPRFEAAVTPETFDPFCALTFTVVAAGGGQKNSFGWYNAKGSKPSLAELYEFIDCNEGKDVGLSKVLNIKDDPRYEGGRIGFFMATTEGKIPPNCVDFGPGGPDPDTLGRVFYSERRFNDDNVGENSWIHLLIMDSRIYGNAFYFGWEDLFTGGDNDFEDLLMRVEGIVCAGGGDDCESGAPGICSRGVMQCRSGDLACVPQVDPGERAESCNGLDDDCDGSVDEGDSLCPDGTVCDRGACVEKCRAGEFACFDGLVCNERGFCVEPACATVECGAGEICTSEGTCRGACDGIVCPLGQECRVGECVELCAGVVCDEGQVCDDGICKADCDCVPCAEGEVCARDGRCVDEGCDFMSCDGGEVCVGGSCVDACENAVCPEGEVCVEGSCIDDGGEGGSGAGGSGGSGTGGSGTGGTGGSGGGAGGSGPGTGGTGSGAGKGAGSKGDGGGCAAAGGSLGLAGLLALGLARRRRQSV